MLMSYLWRNIHISSSHQINAVCFHQIFYLVKWLDSDVHIAGGSGEPQACTALCRRKMSHSFAEGSAEGGEPEAWFCFIPVDKVGNTGSCLGAGGVAAPVVLVEANIYGTHLRCSVQCQGLYVPRLIHGHTDGVGTLALRRPGSQLVGKG